jgi:hypothetical protein
MGAEEFGGNLIGTGKSGKNFVTLSIPCAPAFGDVARKAVSAVLDSIEIPSFSSEAQAADRIADDMMSLYTGKPAAEGKRLYVFVGGNSWRFTVAFLTRDPALALTWEDRVSPTFCSIENVADDVEVECPGPDCLIIRMTVRIGDVARPAVSLDEIMDCLDEHHQRATYGAIAGLVGGAAHGIGRRLGQKTERNSWAVNRRTGWPTGYSEDQVHPSLQEKAEVIVDAGKLLGWFEQNR